MISIGGISSQTTPRLRASIGTPSSTNTASAATDLLSTSVATSFTSRAFPWREVAETKLESEDLVSSVSSLSCSPFVVAVNLRAVACQIDTKRIGDTGYSLRVAYFSGNCAGG